MAARATGTTPGAADFTPLGAPVPLPELPDDQLPDGCDSVTALLADLPSEGVSDVCDGDATSDGSTRRYYAVARIDGVLSTGSKAYENEDACGIVYLDRHGERALWRLYRRLVEGQWSGDWTAVKASVVVPDSRGSADLLRPDERRRFAPALALHGLEVPDVSAPCECSECGRQGQIMNNDDHMVVGCPDCGRTWTVGPGGDQEAE